MAQRILGIDLGTTNSLVGAVDSGFPILLADEEGSRLTPSAVAFPVGGGEPLVGAAALRARAAAPGRCVTSVKRLIGRRPGEVEWRPPFEVAATASGTVEVVMGEDGRFSPEEISALVLGRLREIADAALEESVTQAVITVPAYFNDAQRNTTKRAGELAGLEVVRILNEPTAAALAYGIGRDKDAPAQTVAVYDLGGGTFDVSVLRIGGGIFEVLATCGDSALGGDDIDRALAEWIWEEGGEGSFHQVSTDVAMRLTEAAEAAKRALSDAEIAAVQLPFVDGARSIELEVRREVLESLARPLVEKTERFCRQAVADSGVGEGGLDAALVVGGSTRMPMVREVAARALGREIDTSQHPDEAVAKGAVVQGGVMSGALRDVVLLDVTPLSLGIETFGGLMNVIIPRNSTIPAKAGEMFTNAMANQPAMDIRVLQGEREMAKDNWQLGRVEVPFSPGPKGSARVGVQFEIDADGILTVLARDTATEVDTVLQIQDTAVDVSDAKVEAMVAESIEFAFEDMDERVWTEARLKAEELLPAVDEALLQLGEDLPEEVGAEVRTKARAVRSQLEAEEKSTPALKAAIQVLDDATQDLAVMLVERAMGDL